MLRRTVSFAATGVALIAVSAAAVADPSTDESGEQIAVPAAAVADPSTDESGDRSTATDTRPVTDIHIRIECTPVRTSEDSADLRGVACDWNAVTHPRAAGYRLYRLRVADGEHREVIFQTRDLAHTRHLDERVRLGNTYLYAVEVVGASGQSLAVSEPARVVLPPGFEQLRLGCEVVRVDADRPDIQRPGVACRWSEAHHPAARGYVLYRSVDGRPREAIHRGGLDQLRYLDTEVRPGHRFTYAVVLVDAAGHPLGGGGPVTVGIPA